MDKLINALKERILTGEEVVFGFDSANNKISITSHFKIERVEQENGKLRVVSVNDGHIEFYVDSIQETSDDIFIVKSDSSEISFFL